MKKYSLEYYTHLADLYSKEYTEFCLENVIYKETRNTISKENKYLEERWLPIPGYEGLYEVSDFGRVRSLDRKTPHPRARSGYYVRKGKIMKQTGTAERYKKVGLYKDKVGTDYMVHQLVMLAFKGPPPEGFLVRHYNDIGTDNRLVNLRYGTQRQNVQDAIRNGRLKGRRTMTSLDDVNRIDFMLQQGIGYERIDRTYNVSFKTVENIDKGRTWARVTGRFGGKKW